VREATRILGDVARALEYAHEHGVVHRDVKPENVLLSGGTAVVTDFGIAKAINAAKTQPIAATLTAAGTSLGTPGYMAPEQAAGDEVDARADIYAWGVVAYELVAGTHPFQGKKTAQQLIAAQITESPRPIDEVRKGVPESLASLIIRAMAKDPADRPQSAQDLLTALDDIASTPLPTGKRKAAIAATLAALVLATAFAMRGQIRNLAQRVKGAGGAASTISTLAVLPFTNNSGNSDDQYFSDGMTDELARALSRVPRLRVASRTSSYAFRGKAIPAQQIGRALNVGGLVEGTVRRAGNRLRITAQLTDARNGLVVWTDRFERPADSVFKVQDELTSAIVTALTPSLRGDKAVDVAVESRGTNDPVAYDLYLRGLFEWNRRGIEPLLAGIKDFQSAVARDSSFARAYAALASSYVLLPQYGGYDKYPVQQALDRVRATASKALSLDSTLAEPHAALAAALHWSWRWTEADEEYQRAIALDPNFPTAHAWHAFWLNDVGRAEESLAELKRARELDPLSQVIADNLCQRASALGRFALAEQPCKEAREGNQFDGPALNEMLRGKYDSAAASWGRVRYGHFAGGMVAYSLAQGGHRAEAAKMLKEFERRGATEPMNVALAYLGLGDNDNALLWLDRAVDRHDDSLSDYITPVTGPILAPVRRDPRFRKIVDRMGLSVYAN
jgi:serine/threonine-protein kinase